MLRTALGGDFPANNFYEALASTNGGETDCPEQKIRWERSPERKGRVRLRQAVQSGWKAPYRPGQYPFCFYNALPGGRPQAIQPPLKTCAICSSFGADQFQNLNAPLRLAIRGTAFTVSERNMPSCSRTSSPAQQRPGKTEISDSHHRGGGLKGSQVLLLRQILTKPLNGKERLQVLHGLMISPLNGTFFIPALYIALSVVSFRFSVPAQ